MLKSREPLRRRLQNPVVFLLACALGIPGGWLAWRLHRTQPIPAARPVLDWSKPDFIADANADKVRAELEAARQRAEAARPFVIEASKADKEQLQSLMTAYSTGLKPVREPPLLDLTTVIQVEQLRQKKQTVQTFITANEALRTFLARREENYRE